MRVLVTMLLVAAQTDLCRRCESLQFGQAKSRTLIRLSSTSKPAPDQQDPTATASLPVSETKNGGGDDDNLDDIRERIRQRAKEMNLEASDAPAPEVYDNAGPKNILQQVVDDAMEQAEAEELASQYGDGLNLFEGVKKELELIEWPTMSDNFQNMGIVLGLTVFMVGYVYFLDTTFQKLLGPIFNY